MARRRRILAGAAVVLLALLALGVWRWFPTPREPEYRFLLAWGGPGSGPGQFNHPIGIAIAGDEVFVSDAGNDRIQVFDREGRFLRQFGQPGNGPGQLGRPMLMDAGGGKLHVAEYLNDRVQVFGLDGTPLGVVGSSGSGPGQLDAPGGVAVDAHGRMYVADFFHHRVQLLSPAGKFIRQYGTGHKGIRAGRFNYPTDVALLPNGDVVVADAYNDRVQVFDSAGGFRRKWGGPFALDIPGSAPGWFKTATAVAVGPDGDLFVADFYNDRIQKFTPDGRFLGGGQSSRGEPVLPFDIRRGAARGHPGGGPGA
ncbi:MAG: 6-bladed beta-propeller [Gemmatimonadota bacterium]